VILAVQRRKADAGLLITPFRLSESATRSLGGYSRPRLEVLDGEALAAMLLKFGIGTRQSGEPDLAFFASLEEVSDRLVKFISSKKS